MRAGPTACLLVLASAACTGGPATPPVSSRDSAGIRIVESRRPEWPETGGWSVAPTPTLNIAGPGDSAGSQGPTDSATAGQGVMGAIRLSSGVLVVAYRTAGLRFFRPDGRPVARAGRRATTGMVGATALHRLAGDSLLLFDGAAGRISVWDSAGRAVREITLSPRPGGGPAADAQPLSDGTFVVISGQSKIAVGETGRLRPPVPVLHYSRGGMLMDTLLILPGGEVFALPDTVVPALLGHVPAAAVAGDDVYVGGGETYTIQRYTSAGRLAALFRLPGLDLTLSRAEVQGVRQRRIAFAASPEQRAVLLRTDVMQPDPTIRPAYAAFLVGAAGNLWVADFAGMPYPRESASWRVFNASGRWLGTVQLPTPMRLFDIGSDYVLGVRHDSLGIETVREYTLQRGE